MPHVFWTLWQKTHFGECCSASYNEAPRNMLLANIEGTVGHHIASKQPTHFIDKHSYTNMAKTPPILGHICCWYPTLSRRTIAPLGNIPGSQRADSKKALSHVDKSSNEHPFWTPMTDPLACRGAELPWPMTKYAPRHAIEHTFPNLQGV